MQRHSREGRQIQTSKTSWLFPSGAEIRNSMDGLGPSLIEPSADPETRLKAQRKYHAHMMSVAAAAFPKLKLSLTDENAGRFDWDVKFGPPPPGAGTTEGDCAALAHLRDMYYKHAKMVKDIDAAIAKLPNVIASKAAAEQKAKDDLAYRAARDEALRRRRAAIDAITLEEEPTNES